MCCENSELIRVSLFIYRPKTCFKLHLRPVHMTQINRNGSSSDFKYFYHRGTENTEADTCIVVLIWFTACAGAALAANSVSLFQAVIRG